MSSSNKKAPGARGLPQPFNRQAGHAPQHKPVVAQLKTGVSAQSVKRPVAPPVYRPQATPKAAQPKMAHGAENRKPPVAPPVYRPQQVPKVLQTKSASSPSPHTGQAPRQPMAPPVYRPQPERGGVQAKTAGPMLSRKTPAAPPVYRPQPLPRVLQTKSALAQSPHLKSGKETLSGTNGGNARHNSSGTIQRWIMMGKDLDLTGKTLEESIAVTKSYFTGKEKKPDDQKFALLTNFEDAKQKVSNALAFLDLKQPDSKPITIEDVQDELRTWMGVVPENKKEAVKDKMIGEVLGPQSGQDQYELREKASTLAHMRYYLTYPELAWALVQSKGLQVGVNPLDTSDMEKAVAEYVTNSKGIFDDLGTAIEKVFKTVAQIEIGNMKAAPDYKTFHGIQTWQQFKDSYEKKLMPDSFFGRISFLHDVKSYFAISKHGILDKKPEEIIVKKNKGALKINKEDMRYNLGTVDEADHFVLFMRERGRALWAAPSFTTVAMLEIVKQCQGTQQELTSVAYGIFAFWCIKYPHTATPIHTFHEVMAAAQSFGVPYSPDHAVAENAQKAIGFK
jgi:hypothetical protein